MEPHIQINSFLLVHVQPYQLHIIAYSIICSHIELHIQIYACVGHPIGTPYRPLYRQPFRPPPINIPYLHPYLLPYLSIILHNPSANPIAHNTCYRPYWPHQICKHNTVGKPTQDVPCIWHINALRNEMIANTVLETASPFTCKKTQAEAFAIKLYNFIAVACINIRVCFLLIST